MKNDKALILSKYMPEKAAVLIADWIDDYGCEFKISKSRNSKFGDYRAPFKGAGHKISINYNLNKYAFLVTTVHEFAHLVTWQKHKHFVKPHGSEWKKSFQELMDPFFAMEVFPAGLNEVIRLYLKNPAASSCTDASLFKALRVYDVKDIDTLTVDKVKENELFATKNGRVFKRLNKIRTRYKCVEVKTGLMYLFSPLAEVKLVS